MISMNYKKIIAAGVAAGMMISLLGGCNSEEKPEVTEGQDAPVSSELNIPKETRTIKIGTWYEHYYDSNSKDIYDSPYITDEEIAQKQFDIVKEVEEKYNVKIEYVNLTWTGIQESINNSILAGTPDCDIYEVDVQWGIPAALKGYAVKINDIVPADDDIFTTQNVFSPFYIGNTTDAYIINKSLEEKTIEATYPLAFNMKMIQDAGLEDPRELYKKGEWTWDKFREYLIALTKDTDGDGVNDVYGYGSDTNNTIDSLLMSNGTGIAMGDKETLSSPAVGEVFDFIDKLYHVDKVAVPIDPDDYDVNRTWYLESKTAFWISAAWIMDMYKDSDAGIETTFVPWPVGPSGNKDTNKMKNTVSGNAYIIAQGAEDPEFLYNVFKDYNNWFKDDLSLRDGDLSWWENSVVTPENYDTMKLMGSRPNFDLWQTLAPTTGMSEGVSKFFAGEMTASQFQESYKQTVQDALDGYFK